MSKHKKVEKKINHWYSRAICVSTNEVTKVIIGEEKIYSVAIKFMNKHIQIVLISLALT